MPNKIKPFRPSYLPDSRKLYESDSDRKADAKFYRSKAWRTLRAYKLRLDPLCETCKVAVATQVHHVKPRKQHPELALSIENLSSQCTSCHSKLTRAETGNGRG